MHIFPNNENSNDVDNCLTNTVMSWSSIVAGNYQGIDYKIIIKENYKYLIIEMVLS